MPEPVAGICPNFELCKAAMKKTEPGVIVAAILAIIVVGGGMAFMFLFPERDSSAVVGLMMLILGYYFGTSISSSRKDKAMADASAVTSQTLATQLKKE